MTDFQKYGAVGKPMRIVICGQTGSGKTFDVIEFLNKRYKKYGRDAFKTILFSESAKTDPTWREWGGFKKYVDIHSEQYDEEMATALPNILEKARKKGKRPIIIFDDKGYDQKTNSTAASNHVRYIATAANQNATDLVFLHQRPQYLMGDLVSNAQIIIIKRMDPRADREMAAKKFLGRFPLKRALAIIDDNVRKKHDYLMIDDNGQRRRMFNRKGEIHIPELEVREMLEEEAGYFHYCRTQDSLGSPP